jgi:hypothetical protein
MSVDEIRDGRPELADIAERLRPFVRT